MGSIITSPLRSAPSAALFVLLATAAWTGLVGSRRCWLMDPSRSLGSRTGDIEPSSPHATEHRPLMVDLDGLSGTEPCTKLHYPLLVVCAACFGCNDFESKPVRLSRPSLYVCAQGGVTCRGVMCGDKVFNRSQDKGRIARSHEFLGGGGPRITADEPSTARLEAFACTTRTRHAPRLP